MIDKLQYRQLFSLNTITEIDKNILIDTFFVKQISPLKLSLDFIKKVIKY